MVKEQKFCPFIKADCQGESCVFHVLDAEPGDCNLAHSAASLSVFCNDPDGSGGFDLLLDFLRTQMRRA